MGAALADSLEPIAGEQLRRIVQDREKNLLQTAGDTSPLSIDIGARSLNTYNNFTLK